MEIPLVPEEAGVDIFQGGVPIDCRQETERLEGHYYYY